MHSEHKVRHVQVWSDVPKQVPRLGGHSRRKVQKRVFRILKTVKASKFSHLGNEITTSYVHLHMSNSFRRQKLKDNWYFECKCQRCLDPTEMGTFMDGVKCDSSDCNEGFLLMKDPENLDSEWMCNGCGLEQSPERPRQIVIELLARKEALDR